MFAFRTTWIVHQGKMDEALELLSRELDKPGNENAEWRVYTPYYSPDELVFEDAWETIEAHDAFWEGYNGSDDAAAFFQAWGQLVERSLGTYVWQVKVWR